ncbi:serine dehydratase beta chain, partial [uncultured Parabacteroides sp.]
MESIKQIYRIGHGPSSSHTMGPMRAARMFLERNRGAVRFNVTLYGSLAATGKGHMTDAAILEVLSPVAKTNITWEPKVFLPFHPNGILFQSFDESGEELDNWTIYSIGGGTLANETYNELTQGQVYEMHTIKEIQAWCEKTGHSYWEYVEQCEGPQIWDYLAEVWEVMQQAVHNGLEAEGILPGGLGIRRKASDYMIRAKGYGSSIKSRGMVYAYALAVSEENACGGKIVTAPTCGSCGVMPAVLYHLKESRDFRDSRILRALATAGLFGNVVRTNASVSGA